MKVQTGYLYHIKDEFFDQINKKGLMINHENGHSRPSYLAIKDKEIFLMFCTKGLVCSFLFIKNTFRICKKNNRFRSLLRFK